MDSVGKGIVAGFIAMFALSLLLDPVVLLTRGGWTLQSALGWLLHFFVGPVLWGAAFAFFHDHLRGPSWLRGIVFAFGAWIIVTVTLIASIGANRSGVGFGPAAAAASLLVHIVYGALLGALYGAFADRDVQACPVRDDGLHPAAR